MGTSASSCDNQSEEEDDKSLTSDYSVRNSSLWNNKTASTTLSNNTISVEYLDLVNETSGFWTFDNSVKTRISQVMSHDSDIAVTFGDFSAVNSENIINDSGMALDNSIINSEKQTNVKSIDSEKQIDIAELSLENSTTDSEKQTEIADLSLENSTTDSEKQTDIADLSLENSTTDSEKQTDIADLSLENSTIDSEKQTDIANLSLENSTIDSEKQTDIADLSLENSTIDSEKKTDIADLSLENSTIDSEKQTDIADLSSENSTIDSEKQIDEVKLSLENSTIDSKKQTDEVKLSLENSTIDSEKQTEIADLSLENTTINSEKQTEGAKLSLENSTFDSEKQTNVTHLSLEYLTKDSEKQTDIDNLSLENTTIDSEKQTEGAELSLENSTLDSEKQTYVTGLSLEYSAIGSEKQTDIAELSLENSTLHFEKHTDGAILSSENSTVDSEKQTDEAILSSENSTIDIEKQTIESEKHTDFSDLSLENPSIDSEKQTDIGDLSWENLKINSEKQLNVNNSSLEYTYITFEKNSDFTNLNLENSTIDYEKQTVETDLSLKISTIELEKQSHQTDLSLENSTNNSENQIDETYLCSENSTTDSEHEIDETEISLENFVIHPEKQTNVPDVCSYSIKETNGSHNSPVVDFTNGSSDLPDRDFFSEEKVDYVGFRTVNVVDNIMDPEIRNVNDENKNRNSLLNDKTENQEYFEEGEKIDSLLESHVFTGKNKNHMSVQENHISVKENHISVKENHISIKENQSSISSTQINFDNWRAGCDFDNLTSQSNFDNLTTQYSCVNKCERCDKCGIDDNQNNRCCHVAQALFKDYINHKHLNHDSSDCDQSECDCCGNDSEPLTQPSHCICDQELSDSYVLFESLSPDQLHCGSCVSDNQSKLLPKDSQNKKLDHDEESPADQDDNHLHNPDVVTKDEVSDFSEYDQNMEDKSVIWDMNPRPESGFCETISSGFTDNDHNIKHLSDSKEFEECFEDAYEYQDRTLDIEWEEGSLLSHPEYLSRLRLERIVTADKSTMCPDQPPYVFMCEICEELLENQLQKTEKDSKKKEADLKKQLKSLKEENEKQQKIIQENLQLGPEAKIEATMQHEITRLTSENLDLRESLDKNQDQIRKLKKMLKVYSKRLKDGEAAEIAAEIEKDDTQTNVGNVATIKHRERNYMGMLEYRKEDEGALIKNLIMDVKAKVAVGLLPGLPAYILFMCVRHTDYVNDDEKVRGLLTNTINGIKKCVKKHHSDLERVILWLANTCRLLHTLKQYSGEKAFQADNTPRQNEHCLRNFDLSEYRQVFSDLAVWIYQTMIKQMQETVQQMIVPAVLEHEAIAGLTASKPSGMRGRSSSNANELEDKELSLDSLMKVMNKYSQTLTQHAVDPELVKQIFRQLYYFVGAGALNNLLLRKDMCNWSKGMQIRYNLSHLEQWLRDNRLQESGALVALEPITQASQLLQARKTDTDVDSICEMCSKLSTQQIVKILNLYTPVDEFEERVPISFIRKIQQKLKTRGETDNTLLMDTKYSFPVTFPYNPSNIALETIDVPQQLHLGFLIRH